MAILNPVEWWYELMKLSVESILIKRMSATECGVDRVFIIPTAAVGCSPLKRQHPQTIEFEYMDRPNDADLVGVIAEAVRSEENRFYSAAFVTACNEQLKRFNKRCVQIGTYAKNKSSTPAIWKRESDTTLGKAGEDSGKAHIFRSNRSARKLT